jgi:RimJ/RimL family protein N-acetyltransferase
MGSQSRVLTAWPIPFEPVTLHGVLVRLDPLVPTLSPTVADEIVAAADDAVIWEYVAYDGRTASAVRAHLASLVALWASGALLPFVMRAPTGRVLGVTRLKDAVRADRRLTIGTWLVRDAWGTGVNAETKGLLLAHAFDTLGAMRIEFNSDARNARSHAALEGIGAVREGLLRAHKLLPDGTRRDSVLFSVIDTDWPAVRARIAQRIARQRVDPR